MNFIAGFSLLTTGLFFLLYIFWIKRKNDAIIPLALFQSQRFKIGLLSNFLFRILFGSVIFIISLVLQVGEQFSIVKTSEFLIAFGVGMIVMKFFITKILNIFGYKKTIIFNSILLGFLVILISFSVLERKYLVLLFSLFIYGLSASLNYSTMNVINVGDVGKELQTKANTALNSIRLLGTNCGISFSALFFVIGRYYGYDLKISGAVILLIVSSIAFSSIFYFKRLNI